MGKAWRLILDQKYDGYYNMAVDEAILLGYESFGIPTLRVYGWDKPFISLGCNQNFREVVNSKSEIPFVRRMTGGSAILHYKELTYSLVCSREDLNLPKAVKASYRIICSFLKHFYSQLGIKVSFANDLELTSREIKKNLGKYKNFCFSSWQHFDLLAKGKKIGGNAQRHRKNIIFQHGSIPQEIDPSYIIRTIKDPGDFKERTTSLEEVLGRHLSFDSLTLLLYSSFKLTFGVEFNQDKLLESEKEMVDFLLKGKYKTKAWNNYKMFENA
ncbi:MAG: lipoate--protein ligase family protein [Candidatus Omnitrophica bacterium]|nr:lipoate--protein ligase family protein [Candidatus Omnitrophota bacterium]